MCVATPMRVVSIEGRRAKVDAAGAQATISVELCEGVAVGDYVIVHAGYALHRMSAADAAESLAILERLEQSWQS
ncbi:MAG: HypC/HybG/HupF family hydrogenase formation chaperone [Deltaproteobacteria bacterium]|nr:HypC/HybG/HupF family hydrogenase formation chaperone [Deltaproteobacteria bacterium]